MNYVEHVEFVEKTLDEARLILAEEHARGLQVNTKFDGSAVTQIDLKIEQLFRERISAAYPNHGIVGEEFDSTKAGAQTCWLIDPIDGTLSLTRGIPLYGTIVSLLVDGEPALGAIDLPGINRRLTGVRGVGAWLNGEPFHYHPPNYPRRSMMIGVGDRAQFRKADQMAVLEYLQREFEYVRTYPDVFGHFLAITGAVSLAIDPALRPWDEGATGVIATTAGCGFAAVNRRVASDGVVRRDILIGEHALVDEFAQRMSKAL